MQLLVPAVSSPLPLSNRAAGTPLYRLGLINNCPDCGQSQWIVGRVHAECASCETVLPITAGRYVFG